MRARRRLIGAARPGCAGCARWRSAPAVAWPAAAQDARARGRGDAAASNPVTVSPLPGTADASPATQISFLGAAGTQVSDVSVVGSRSGAHTGRLQAYSTGTGESFLPAHPFLRR